jgi:hypothetical protein
MEHQRAGRNGKGVNLKPTEIPSGRIKRLNIQGAGDRPEYRTVAKLIRL